MKEKASDLRSQREANDMDEREKTVAKTVCSVARHRKDFETSLNCQLVPLPTSLRRPGRRLEGDLWCGFVYIGAELVSVIVIYIERESLKKK